MRSVRVTSVTLPSTLSSTSGGSISPVSPSSPIESILMQRQNSNYSRQAMPKNGVVQRSLSTSLHRSASLASIASPVSRIGGPLLSDVSALEPHRLNRVCTPRSEKQLQEIIQWCKKYNQKICLAGAAHTMGAQTLLEGGVLLQMKFLNRITYDPATKTVRAEAGALWSEIIRVLNYYGRTPKTLQSYCSFSVGGSIGANVHGITSDEQLSSSVVSLRILLASGEVLDPVCREGEHAEVFAATVGGYGLTGIILSAVFATEPNLPIQTEVVPLSRSSGNFLPVYQRLRNDASIVTKIVRMNISNFNECTLYIYRAMSRESRESQLPWVPCETLPLFKQIGYSLLFHRNFFQSLRFKYENLTQTPIDWSAQPDRNTLLFETAAPLAKLFQPFSTFTNLFTSPIQRVSNVFGKGTKSRRQQQALANSDHRIALSSSAATSLEEEGSASNGRIKTYQDETFLLKEYFVPEDLYPQFWVEIEKQLRGFEKPFSSNKIHLLNITMRSVKENEDTLLTYAPINKNKVVSGSKYYIASVFYFRLSRHAKSEEVLNAFDRSMIDITLGMGGTFYLPYRISYTKEQLQQAYPNLRKFLAMKRKLDPQELFQSAWYNNLLDLTEEDEYHQHQLQLRKQESKEQMEAMQNGEAEMNGVHPSSSSKPFAYQFRHRPEGYFSTMIQSFTVALDELGTNSYARNSETVNRIVSFIHFVLPVESKVDQLKSVLTHAALLYNTNRSTVMYRCLDEAVYESLKARYQGTAYARFKSTLASLQVLSKTRAQVGGELKEVLVMLPDSGASIRSVASIGDHGRFLGLLGDFLPNVKEFHNIHDAQSRIMTHVESGKCLLPTIKHHAIDYGAVRQLQTNDRFDLITMTQGLHHLTPENLDAFLKFVVGHLNEGGYFLIREHDAPPGSQVELLAEFAHILFNASSGVSWKEEQNEARNFQSSDTWKSIVESYGLKDTWLLNRQDTDSTEDYMMLFQKPRTRHSANASKTSSSSSSSQPQRTKSIEDYLTETSSSAAAASTPKDPKAPESRDPTNTLFMPAEFYIVDSVAHLRDFLAEQPWYRFPWFHELRNTWSLFALSVRMHRSSYGIKSTLGNSIFTSNLIACVFTSYVYIQVGIFAVLLRMVLGEEYSASNYMKVVYTRSPAANGKSSSNVSEERVEAKVDRYHAFSDWLNEMSTNEASKATPIKFVQINNKSCQELLVKVEFYQSAVAATPKQYAIALANNTLVEPTGSISVPAFTSNDKATVSAIYRVPLSQLAAFLQACQARSTQIRGKPFVFDY